MPHSVSVYKFISCHFIQSFPDIVYIIPYVLRKNAKNFHLPVLRFYFGKRVFCFWVQKLPSSWMTLSLQNSLLRTFLGVHPFFNSAQRKWIFNIFYTELSVGNICIYEIDRRTSYPYIHDILLLTDIVLKHYTIIECLERYTVYL